MTWTTLDRIKGRPLKRGAPDSTVIAASYGPRPRPGIAGASPADDDTPVGAWRVAGAGRVHELVARIVAGWCASSVQVARVQATPRRGATAAIPWRDAPAPIATWTGATWIGRSDDGAPASPATLDDHARAIAGAIRRALGGRAGRHDLQVAREVIRAHAHIARAVRSHERARATLDETTERQALERARRVARLAPSLDGGRGRASMAVAPRPAPVQVAPFLSPVAPAPSWKRAPLAPRPVETVATIARPWTTWTGATIGTMGDGRDRVDATWTRYVVQGATVQGRPVAPIVGRTVQVAPRVQVVQVARPIMVARRPMTWTGRDLDGSLVQVVQVVQGRPLARCGVATWTGAGRMVATWTGRDLDGGRHAWTVLGALAPAPAPVHDASAPLRGRAGDLDDSRVARPARPAPRARNLDATDRLWAPVAPAPLDDLDGRDPRPTKRAIAKKRNNLFTFARLILPRMVGVWAQRHGIKAVSAILSPFGERFGGRGSGRGDVSRAPHGHSGDPSRSPMHHTA